MNVKPKLDLLEADVLMRIAAHRDAAQKTAGALPVALLVCITALVGGLWTGIAGSRHAPQARGSEAALLADDLRLAPSSLLVSNQ